LGVDTVKQAEVFATIREAYNIPRDENLKLRDYSTLAHVIRFVHEKRPDLAEVTLASRSAVAAAQATLAAEKAAKVGHPSSPVPVSEEGKKIDPVHERILALVVEKTGY